MLNLDVNEHVQLILEQLIIYKNSTNTKYELNGEGVTIADIANIARDDFSKHKIEVEISEDTKAKLKANSEYLKECLVNKEVIYGVNTGFGGSADVKNEDFEALNNVLLIFLNCGTKTRCLDVGWVRASMFTRVNSLSRAYSGVRPEVVDHLCVMINKDIVPQVPLRGSISASGDLMPLSYVASCMAGIKKNSKVYFKGKLNSTVESAFQQVGLKFIDFQPKEVLGVINSSSCSAVLGSINLFDFSQCLLLTELITAMTLECLKGRLEAFHVTVDKCLSHWGLKQFSESIRFLLKESNFVRKEDTFSKGELFQDRYALRTSPQWMGPCIEVFKESLRRINVELNSTNDNPIIDSVERKIVHCGNFQGSSIVVAMDQTRQSMQMCGRMIFAQLSEVLNHHMNGCLPPNLSGSDYTRDYGFKGLDIALAAYTSELDSLASPMTNHVMSAEMHNQSINSMALVSARKTSDALELLQLIISSSILCLCQAVDLRWIQLQINVAWQKLTKECFSEVIPITNQDWFWYDLAFRPDYAVVKLKESFKQVSINGQYMNGTFDRFLSKLKQEIADIMNLVNHGFHIENVSADLGLGTRKLYRCVRKTLGVEFHKGATPMDDSLEKIVTILKDRSIIDILIDAFKS